MDALDLLEQQHREVRELLDRLAAGVLVVGGEASRREALCALEAHVRVEEAYVYVACAGKIHGDVSVEDAVAEHARILGIARSLLASPPLGPRFSARLAALTERFARHAEHEEDIVFPRLKCALTDEELDVLGEEIARAHGRLMEQEPLSLRVLGRVFRGFDGSRVRLRRTSRRMAPPSA